MLKSYSSLQREPVFFLINIFILCFITIFLRLAVKMKPWFVLRCLLTIRKELVNG